MCTVNKFSSAICALFLAFASFNANALNINWVDWTSSSSANGFTAFGTITSGTSTIDVTYNNPQGIAFFYDGVGAETDFWAQRLSTGGRGRDAATSPFTSTGPTGIDNIPTGTDMIALNRAGVQTLTFSEAIANPVFSFISLNSNGYGFDQDFELLSYGHPIDGNDCGWWGCGTSTKNVTATEYQLLGTGEPHGSLRFTGTFDTLSWRSLSSEHWNGFTMGVQGTAAQVFPCQVNPNLPQCTSIPEPATLLLLGLGLAGMGFSRRQNRH